MISPGELQNFVFRFQADWLPQADDAAQAPVGGVAWRSWRSILGKRGWLESLGGGWFSWEDENIYDILL
jgi:phage terminase large subunit-like protein